jgi:hypothetical protein
VVFSLLGYFVCMIIVLTAAVGAMIGLSSFSTFEGARHYSHSRPVPERNITAPNTEPRLFMAVPNTKEASPAKNVETNSAVATDEKTDAKKSKPQKHKAFARRDNYRRPSYWNAPGYAEAPSVHFPIGDYNFAAAAVIEFSRRIPKQQSIRPAWAVTLPPMTPPGAQPRSLNLSRKLQATPSARTLAWGSFCDDRHGVSSDAVLRQ